MLSKGIVFNNGTGRYETDYGWFQFNFTTGEVLVEAPGANEWFDADRAMGTAQMFMRYSPTPGMALALAIHGQYAAWKGARSLMKVWQRQVVGCVTVARLTTGCEHEDSYQTTDFGPSAVRGPGSGDGSSFRV